MKVKDYIKSHGLPGMTYIAKQTGKDRRTLYKWYAEQFEFFEIIVLGCVSKQPIITTPVSLVAGTGETTIGCACGWVGNQSQLVNDTCPTCGKEFALYPPSKGEKDE